MMLEQYKVRPDGTLLTRGPGTYKIPSLGNVPEEFNVSLLRHSNNPRAVFSSKVSKLNQLEKKKKENVLLKGEVMLLEISLSCYGLVLITAHA